MEMMKGIRRIVIPVDNTEDSERAVKKGIALAKMMNIKAEIITVNDTHQFISSVVLEDKLKKEATEFLEKFKKMAQELGVKIDTQLMTGKPSEEIIKFANKDDLIVIAPHDKSKGIDRYMELNVCDRVVKKAPCSVLVLKLEE
jgi:nucleotide-binding universal stress UspA family protein